MRRWCRTQRPMCCSTGEHWESLFFRDNYAESAVTDDAFSLGRKSSEESVRERQKVVALANMKEPSLLQFYISREWLNKFNTFAEPGPISNHTFLCQHGGDWHDVSFSLKDLIRHIHILQHHTEKANAACALFKLHWFSHIKVSLLVMGENDAAC